VALHEVSAAALGVGDAHDVRYAWGVDRVFISFRPAGQGTALHRVSAPGRAQPCTGLVLPHWIVVDAHVVRCVLGNSTGKVRRDAPYRIVLI